MKVVSEEKMSTGCRESERRERSRITSSAKVRVQRNCRYTTPHINTGVVTHRVVTVYWRSRARLHVDRLG